MTDQPDWMTPDPWEVAEDEAAAARKRRKYSMRDAWRREYESRPERIAQRKAYRQRPEVKERLRNYTREWKRRWRAERKAQEEGDRVGGLHALHCTGPHRTHKGCRPIPVYRREDAA